MLKIKALLGKILNWYGFRFDWSKQATNNTTDTWVPVFREKEIQHRVVPRNLANDFSVQYGESNGSVSSYGNFSADIDISSLVGGYNYALNNIWSNSFEIVPIRAYISGTTLTVFFKNISGNYQSFAVYYSIIRWKSEV